MAIRHWGWGLPHRAPGSHLYLPVRLSVLPGNREQEEKESKAKIPKSHPWDEGGRLRLKAGGGCVEGELWGSQDWVQFLHPPCVTGILLSFRCLII